MQVITSPGGRVEQLVLRSRTTDANGTAALRDVLHGHSNNATAVHANLLEDLVYPTEIVGKRQRYRLDGSKLLKVYLDPKDRNTTEYKLDTFAGVYKKLTGKEVTFDFPVTEAA